MLPNSVYLTILILSQGVMIYYTVRNFDVNFKLNTWDLILFILSAVCFFFAVVHIGGTGIAWMPTLLQNFVVFVNNHNKQIIHFLLTALLIWTAFVVMYVYKDSAKKNIGDLLQILFIALAVIAPCMLLLIFSLKLFK